VAGLDLLRQQPSTCWSVEMCFPSRSFWGWCSSLSGLCDDELTAVFCLLIGRRPAGQYLLHI